jgi:hypothetical protein
LLHRAGAAVAHGVSCAALCHAAHEPLRRALALFKRVADAAHEALRWGMTTSLSKVSQSVALGALCGVVHSFGANATMFIQPLGGKVDGWGSGRSIGINWRGLHQGINMRGRCHCLAAGQAHVKVTSVASEPLFTSLKTLLAGGRVQGVVAQVTRVSLVVRARKAGVALWARHSATTHCDRTGRDSCSNCIRQCTWIMVW